MPDTYGDLAGYKEWADDRGHSYPVTSGADAQITVALLNAAEYLDGRYRGRWKGVKATIAQVRAWPRTGARDEDGVLVDEDDVPTAVAYAAYEATKLILAGTDMSPAIVRGGAVKRERVVAGPVESETEYADGAPARTAFTAIDDLLRGLVRSNAGVWLERV